MYGSFSNTNVHYSSSAIRQIARLPGVKHVEAAISLNTVPLSPKGAPRLDAVTNISTIASVNGSFFDQDRLAVLEGRMANPNRPDEIVMTALAAHLLGVHVGQVVPFGLDTQEQENLRAFGTPSVPPHRRINAHLVGLIQLNNAIVEDDIDRFPTFIVFTPALAKEVLADSGIGAGGAVSYGFQLDHGNSGVAAVEREFVRLVPPGAAYEFHATAPIAAKVDRTVKPLSIALGVFGAVAALAALLIGVQAISRQLRDADEELTVLRALGARPTTIAAHGLMGILGALVIGSFLAATVAVALSPLSPLGPVRTVYPGSPVAFDWTVLGLGLLVLIGGLGAIAVALAYRGAPHRAARRSQQSASGYLEGRDSGCVVGTTGTGRRRGALRPRFGPWSRRGANAFGVAGRRPRRCARGSHPHLWKRPAIPGIASRALRVGLELHAQPEQHGSSPSSFAPRTRSQRRRVDRVRLQRFSD